MWLKIRPLLVTVHRGGHQSTNNRRTVIVQKCRRFGQADRRCVPRVRKPSRSSADVVLLNGYEFSEKLRHCAGSDKVKGARPKSQDAENPLCPLSLTP